VGATIYITGDTGIIVNDLPATQQEQESLREFSSKLLYPDPPLMSRRSIRGVRAEGSLIARLSICTRGGSRMENSRLW
jgi:hypothetical protein